ncbi:MAG: HU family DNA-binding protein [Bacteroidaceae bacterium]|nr:HU family DNA-binding protein [Bacteroidaceae bacterium]
MIVFKTTKRANPKNGSKAFYAEQVRLGQITLNDLAEEMAQESTVTRHDILAVLSSLQQHVINHLQQGKSVRLGDLGSFHVRITSKPSEKEEEVSADNVKGLRVHFRRSAIMMDKMRLTNPQITFANVKTLLTGQNQQTASQDAGDANP